MHCIRILQSQGLIPGRMVQSWQLAGTALSGCCCQGFFVQRYSPMGSRGGHTSPVSALPAHQTAGTHPAQRAFRAALSHCPAGAEATHPCTELWGTTQPHDHPADRQMQSGWHHHSLCSIPVAPGAHRRMEVGGTCPAAGQGQGCHPPCSPQTGLRKPAVERCAPQPASLAQRRLGNV